MASPDLNNSSWLLETVHPSINYFNCTGPSNTVHFSLWTYQNPTAAQHEHHQQSRSRKEFIQNSTLHPNHSFSTSKQSHPRVTPPTAQSPGNKTTRATPPTHTNSLPDFATKISSAFTPKIVHTPRLVLKRVFKCGGTCVKLDATCVMY